MYRYQLGIILALLFGSIAAADSAPRLSHEADVLDRLAPAIATEDPARIAAAYRAMGSYGEVAASMVEAAIDALGTRRLSEGDIVGAIAAFRLNTETFPDSGGAWRSLAEAVSAGGDRETGLVYSRRADTLVLRGTNVAVVETPHGSEEPWYAEYRSASVTQSRAYSSSGARHAATMSGWASSQAVARRAPSAICSAVMSPVSCSSLYSAPE